MSAAGEETSARLTPFERAGRLANRVLPVLLLLVQIFWLHQELVSNRRVRPTRVSDTESYVVLAQKDTVEGALTHYRTYGYPLLIRIFGWRELPGRELWMFFGAVICFFAGVTAYTGSGWLALAAASPLLYGDTLKLFGRLQPDFVSCAYVLAAVGALLMLTSRPRNGALWVLLTLTALLAYQSRPATLFIIGWLPLMGWALRTLRERRMSRAAAVWAAAVGAVVVLPYLAFMSWRYARVGDFGLVSFGGYNMSGLAASLVDEEMLGELEGEHKKIAKAIYGRRARRGWTPYDPAAGSLEWFQQYSDNIWKVSAPAATIQARAERKAAPPGSPHRYQRLVVNDKLAAFSKDVIRRRLSKYVRWVVDANLFGWRQLGGSTWVVWPAVALAVSWLGLWAARRRGYLPVAASAFGDGRIAGLLLLGTSYFLGYVLLISLLSFPFDRYYYGTVLLLPSVLCVAFAGTWGAVLGGIRERSVARTV